MIVVPTSDWGKSTLAMLMEQALPGMSTFYGNAAKVSSEHNRFARYKRSLTRCRFVFIDEADKIKMPTPNFMALADRQATEEKFGEEQSEPKMGVAVLMGNAIPLVEDLAKPGVRTRLQWAYRNDEAQPMTQHERSLVYERWSESIAYLRARMLHNAHDLYEQMARGGDISSKEFWSRLGSRHSGPHVADAISDGAIRSVEDVIGEILRHTGDHADQITTNELAATVARIAVRDVGNEDVGKAMSSLFGDAGERKRLTRADGSRPSGYKGFRWVE